MLVNESQPMGITSGQTVTAITMQSIIQTNTCSFSPCQQWLLRIGIQQWGETGIIPDGCILKKRSDTQTTYAITCNKVANQPWRHCTIQSLTSIPNMQRMLLFSLQPIESMEWIKQQYNYNISLLHVHERLFFVQDQKNIIQQFYVDFNLKVPKSWHEKKYQIPLI